MLTNKALLAIPAALALSTAAQATLVAGWDTFLTGTINGGTIDATVTDGLDASLVVTGNQPVLFSDGRGASTDGTFGALAAPAANTDTGSRGVALALANGSLGQMTISLTNTSAGDIQIGQLVFDSYARRPNASRTYELSVLAGGGLSDGIVFTSDPQIITHTGGSVADTTIHDEISISFAGLADSVLGVGESVDLLLDWTGGTVGAGGHDLYIDNLGFSTELPVTAIPGDNDGDGDIDDTDLGISISNFTGPTGSGKLASEGDTDGDGDVDDTDLGVSISGFTGPLSPAAVPEPTSLALLTLGGLLAARRRRA